MERRAQRIKDCATRFLEMVPDQLGREPGTRNLDHTVFDNLALCAGAIPAP